MQSLPARPDARTTPERVHDRNSAAPTVLHVTTCFAGGVSRAVSSVVRATPEQRHVLLAAGADLRCGALLDGFAEVVELPRGFLARLLAVRAQVRAQVHASASLVVHAHSSVAGVLTRLVAPRGTEILYQPHGFAFEKTRSLTGIAALVVEAVLARRPQRVVVLSPREDALAKRLRPGARTVLVPNAPSVQLAERCPARTRTSTPTVAMVGRVCPQKDPEVFVEVVRLVRRRIADLRAVWIGGGAADDEARLRAAGITVTGWVEGDDLARHIDDADLVVHTARYEGFPISVLDAFARRVPVVARDIPAFDSTPIVRAPSSRALADAVTACLVEPAAADEALRAGEAVLATMNATAQETAFGTLYEGCGTQRPAGGRA